MSELGKLLRVDPTVAQSLFGSNRVNGPASAERELMVAVLSDAIECYWKFQNSKKRSAIRLYQEAKNWLFGDNQTLPFSFRNVCDTLELDPSYIRRGILAAGRSATAIHRLDCADGPESDPANIKRKLKSGRQWKGGSRLSRGRVRPLGVRSRG